MFVRSKSKTSLALSSLVGLLLFTCMSSSFAAFTQPVVIDVSNPQFRPLIIALPPQETVTGEEPVLQDFAKQSGSEMRGLLEFTGFFRIIAEDAYKELLKGPVNVADAKAKPVATSAGNEFAPWKALGIDAVVKSKITRAANGRFNIDLTAIDILQGRIALQQEETFHTNRELVSHLKRFIDRLLEIYTNKPGIFSSRIVFIGKRDRKQEGQVFVCDIDGQNVEQLTFAPKVPHLSPSWNSDGTKILFTSYSKGQPDLYLYEVLSGKLERIASSGNFNSGGAFARNDKVIAYSQSTYGKTDIFLKKLGNKSTTRLMTSRGMDVDPTFSPDGKWLASVSGRFGNPHIFRASLTWGPDGESFEIGAEQRLTYAGKQNITPAWSPDSQKIAFSGFDATVARFDVFKMNIDGSFLERLTQHEGSNENPSWSPNGQHLIFHSSRSGVPQLYMMNKDGSNQRLIPTGLYEAKTPDWGPQRP